MHGIVGYSVNLPRYRLAREQISEALGERGGRGRRAVAGYDEDTTSMGVEAARSIPGNAEAPGVLAFATTAPAYFDKTNATAIHAALSLPAECMAVDLGTSIRAGAGALRMAAREDGIAVLADVRIGRPGSGDERDGGDGSAAFRFGSGDGVIAELLAHASRTGEFLDRWRVPGEHGSSVWEERFGLGHYKRLGTEAITAALAGAGLESVDHLVVSSPHARAARALAGKAGDGSIDGAALAMEIGNLGAADIGVHLAAVLDVARPGETIAAVLAADGCDVLILRVTDAIEDGRQPEPVTTQLERAREIGYVEYLTWRDVLRREPPRRPDPQPPEAPPAARASEWKFAFHGSRCMGCGMVHLPPQRVCAKCGKTDEMEPAALADTEATVATHTVDHLSYSLAPPVLDVVIDFDGGGRYQCELTDAAAGEVAIGNRVRMTFRRSHTARGIHNYCWKARPAEGGR